MQLYTTALERAEGVRKDSLAAAVETEAQVARATTLLDRVATSDAQCAVNIASIKKQIQAARESLQLAEQILSGNLRG